MARGSMLRELALISICIVSAKEAEAQVAAPAAAPLPPSVRIPEPPECPPYVIAPGTPVSTPEQTRAAVMAFVEAGKRHDVEEMDSTMAPDATQWFAGSGCVDRTQWGPAHYANPHPPSDFIRVELTGLVVEGDRAALQMITEQAWPGGGYLRFSSIHVRVSNGKIVELRQYSIAANGRQQPPAPGVPGEN